MKRDGNEISFGVLQRAWEEATKGLEPRHECFHDNALVTRDNETDHCVISVHCPDCGLFGLMDARTAVNLGWI